MSEAIERHPGALYFITRRCHWRQYRLRPDNDLAGAIGVILHDACRLTGVKILAVVFMSNHYHAIVEDVEGRLPEWESHVNGLLARYVNATQGVVGHVWDAQEDNDIELQGLDQLADKIAYTVANPVHAGLVHSPSAWPGVITRINDIGTGRGVTYQRPKKFFRKKGPVSKEATVPMHAPTGIDPVVFKRAVKAALKKKLAEARAAVTESGRGYAGAAAVKKQAPFDAPKTHEPRNVGLEAKARARLLGSTSEETRAMIARRNEFLRRYALALSQWRKGEHDAAFPRGTYKLCRHCGARSEATTAEATQATATATRTGS